MVSVSVLYHIHNLFENMLSYTLPMHIFYTTLFLFLPLSYMLDIFNHTIIRYTNFVCSRSRSIPPLDV